MKCLPKLPTKYYVDNGRLADAILALSDCYRHLAPQEILERIRGLVSLSDQYWQGERSHEQRLSCQVSRA